MVGFLAGILALSLEWLRRLVVDLLSNGGEQIVTLGFRQRTTGFLRFLLSLQVCCKVYIFLARIVLIGSGLQSGGIGALGY